jgi:hypothetical protein
MRPTLRKRRDAWDLLLECLRHTCGQIAGEVQSDSLRNTPPSAAAFTPV